MAVTYVRNETTGEFEQVGPGSATTDTTLSQVGKPADAGAVGVAVSRLIPLSQKGALNGVATLNANGKVPADQLPNYTDANYVASDEISSLTAKQTWTSEQTYNYEDYGLELVDTIAGVAAGFKAPRGLFNQLFVDDIVFTRGTNEQTEGLMADEIGIYIWSDVDSKAATRDSTGNISTEGYNNLLGYEKVAAITKDGGLILKSSTAGSSKYFKITVNDSGTISATEVI